MNLRASKRGFKKEKQMIMFIVASSTVMLIHCCIWFEQKKSVVRDFKGEI